MGTYSPNHRIASIPPLAALILTSARYPQLSRAPGVSPFASTLFQSRIGRLGTVATVRKPAGCCIRPPLDPIGIHPPLVRSLLLFPPYPSLAMLSCLGSGIGGTFSHAFRSLLRPGSLPIDRDRLAGLGVAIWGVGAFSTYSCVLRE